MSNLVIRPYGPPDLVWAAPMLDREFGGRLQARRGELLDVLDLPGLVAQRGGKTVGLLTYQQSGADYELALLWAAERRRGVGTALLQALQQEVAGGSRIWVVTTNDNLDALRFYQRRGFVLRVLRPGAVADARRRLKPEMPEFGGYGIPLRDEIELELATLTGSPAPQRGQRRSALCTMSDVP